MLGTSLFVETSSWWIRANASSGNFGHYVSRSNIYLYSARLFSLCFSILLAIQIENHYPTSTITLGLAIGFSFSSLLQFLLLSLRKTRAKVIKIVLMIMFLQDQNNFVDQSRNLTHGIDKNLFLSAFFSSLIFASGISIPSFLSSIFIDNRLVISNLGQVINAFGSIIVLIVVDQRLFRALDEGRLGHALTSYTHARVASSTFMAIVYYLIYLAI
jgi:hypothetical protein